MEYNNKAKLKEQNSSRLRDSKKNLAVTKEKGTGEDGGKGRIRWGKKWGIVISMYNE